MKYLRSIGIGSLILISKLLPFNWIIGSYHLTFSWTTMMAPVIAQQFGIAWVGLFFIHQKLFLSGSVLTALLFRIPLIFAAIAFKKQNVWTSILIPLVCMSLFVMHDVGSQAWMYSLYWLIPVGLFFIADSMITRSLSASFVAHAIGSVLWLYFGDIAASTWVSLIPIVFCERILMAAGMVGLHYVVVKIRTLSWWRAYAFRLGIS